MLPKIFTSNPLTLLLCVCMWLLLSSTVLWLATPRFLSSNKSVRCFLCQVAVTVLSLNLSKSGALVLTPSTRVIYENIRVFSWKKILNISSNRRTDKYKSRFSIFFLLYIVLRPPTQKYVYDVTSVCFTDPWCHTLRPSEKSANVNVHLHSTVWFHVDNTIYNTTLLPSDKCTRNVLWYRAQPYTHSHQSH